MTVAPTRRKRTTATTITWSGLRHRQKKHKPFFLNSRPVQLHPRPLLGFPPRLLPLRLLLLRQAEHRAAARKVRLAAYLGTQGVRVVNNPPPPASGSHCSNLRTLWSRPPSSPQNSRGPCPAMINRYSGRKKDLFFPYMAMQEGFLL